MPRTLADWLGHIEAQHPQAIALGLERVAEVLGRLDAKISCPLLVVGGTNGKGSTCALLEAILRAARYRTGLYTSPHLLRYNERVRIDGSPAPDDALCESFAAVESARQGVPLTYFEFGTLSAAWLFARARLDAAILEVGLGGRLDAVNAFDADCAVVTGIAVDHVEYLGSDRDSIAREKAGIFRAGRPAVVAEPDPPPSLIAPGPKHFLYGKDFGFAVQDRQWNYWGPGGTRPALAHPALRGAIQLRNAAAALAALDALRERLPVATQEVRRGLAEVTLAGRFQVLPGRPQVILDVAHNPEAATVLAENLAASGFSAETIAVFGMLRDKDIAGVVRALDPRVTRWLVASLPGPRGASGAALAEALAEERVRGSVAVHGSIADAFAVARETAGENDKIVAFGSFLTVAEVMAWLNRRT